MFQRLLLICSELDLLSVKPGAIRYHVLHLTNVLVWVEAAVGPTIFANSTFILHPPASTHFDSANHSGFCS